MCGVLLWNPRLLAGKGGGSLRLAAETKPARTGILEDPGESQGRIFRDKGPGRLGPWENWGLCNPESRGRCQAGQE